MSATSNSPARKPSIWSRGVRFEEVELQLGVACPDLLEHGAQHRVIRNRMAARFKLPSSCHRGLAGLGYVLFARAGGLHHLVEGAIAALEKLSAEAVGEVVNDFGFPLRD